MVPCCPSNKGIPWKLYQLSFNQNPKPLYLFIDSWFGCEHCSWYHCIEKAFTCGDEDGWTFIGKKHGVQCYLKESNGLTFTKGVGVVDAPAEVIVNYTADMSTRKTYDDLHKKDTILHTLDPAKIGEALDASVDLAEIRHSEFKSPFVVISPRDTVMASCRIRSENGVFTTLLVSVKGYKKPSSKYVRANVLSAGIKLEPVPGNPEKCIMTNVQCMDPNG